jgi:hypothetical protein
MTMGIGYLLGFLFCVVYAVLVWYFGVVKKSPMLLKLVKMKLSKKMSDETAVKVSGGASIVVLIVGIVLFVIGLIQG